jgi:hypothetical protein
MRLLFFEFKGSSLAVIIVAALFVVSLFWGVSRGKSNAISEGVYKQVEQLVTGLDYFYQDQNRFPTVEELTAESIALTYFSSIPNDTALSKNCERSFFYTRLSFTGYQLNFCLASDSGEYKKGWNTLTVQN